MMKNLYFSLLFTFILVACNALNETNSRSTETQSTLVSKESLTPKPEATGALLPITKIPNTPTPTSTVEMKAYYDKELGIQVSYPANWIATSERMFTGNDGYLLIKKLDNYHSPNLGHVAVDFANTYYPQFAVYCIGDGGAGCAIEERKFIDTEKIIQIIPYQSTSESAKYFSIETTRQYYLQIVGSITWNDNAFEPTPTEFPTSSPEPTEVNLKDISLVEMPSLDYQENMIKSPLFEIGGDNCGATNKKNNLKLVTDNSDRMKIQLDGKTIFNFSSWGFSESPPWLFCQWDKSWALETHEIVVINGIVLNHETGYDEIFGWHLLREKPVYFVKIDSKYSISIDGEILPIKYDEVAHYKCCGEHGYNPQTNGVNTWFNAKRNGVWYTVLITVQ